MSLKRLNAPPLFSKCEKRKNGASRSVVALGQGAAHDQLGDLVEGDPGEHRGREDRVLATAPGAPLAEAPPDAAERAPGRDGPAGHSGAGSGAGETSEWVVMTSSVHGPCVRSRAAAY